MLQCAAEGRIDDDGFAPPQAQDLPDDGADVVHIHLLYDPTRLDLSFKSIAQRIEFIGRFGEEQWRFRQKCQLIFSAHLLTPLSYPDARAVVGRRERVRAISKKASKLRYICPGLRFKTWSSLGWPESVRAANTAAMPTIGGPVNQDLPLPLPGEGRGPGAPSLADRRLSHRLEGPNRLCRLAPQSRFVAAHAVKQGRVKMGKTPEALG